MRPPQRIQASVRLFICCLVAAIAPACLPPSPPDETGNGGTPGGGTGAVGARGGTTAGSGGRHPTGTGGSVGGGGVSGDGGSGSGGAVGSGGSSGRGGATGAGGAPGTGGHGGGAGGITGTGGRGGTTGAGGAGGATGSGGATINCMEPALTGGTRHCSSNSQGNAGSGYTWTIWSSGTGGCLTTYPNAGAAFSATWNNSGDFLARVGLHWDKTKTFDQYGTITADFAETKTGTAGGFSYIGIYGWSVKPTIEYYIVEDSYHPLPFNPGGTKVGEVTLDGGTYDIIKRTATGASIDGSASWQQFYSIRQQARQCGHISITEHFKAWDALGLTLGKMYEAKVLVEAGGGTGSIQFTTARVTAQ